MTPKDCTTGMMTVALLVFGMVPQAISGEAAPERSRLPRMMPLRHGVRVMAVDEAPSDDHESRDEQTLEQAPTPDEVHETIREQDPAMHWEISRQVVRQPNGEVLNDGSWEARNADGAIVATGSYVDGMRQGRWQRVFAAGEGEMFTGPLFRQFQAPFTSVAHFDRDQLQGIWLTFDAEKRMMARWQFAHGKRQGTHEWWYPNGQKRREANFQNDRLEGQFVEWAADGQVQTDQTFVEGHALMKQQSTWPSGKLRYEVQAIAPEEVSRTTFDFLAGVALQEVDTAEGEPMRHGPFVAYYPNGSKQVTGQYRFGVPDGEFTWYHPSGQVATVGSYIEGAEEGQWSWWSPEGKRTLEGSYAAGQQTGTWSWFSAQGRLARQREFTPGTPRPNVERPQLARRRGAAQTRPRRNVPESVPREPVYQATRPGREPVL